jgi:hypothetical protein
VILGHALPLGKAFFRLAKIPVHDLLFLSRFVMACLLPHGKLSAAVIAASMREQPRHRSNVLRWLRGLPATVAQDWLEALFGNLLQDEPPSGIWVFILDQTYCGHQSTRMENTFSTAHRGKRQKHAPKNKRKKRKKQHQSYCHCFVMGLLLTPNGLRLPLFFSYYTKEYCAQRCWKYRKQTELAALLIRRLRVPEQARVVVVGDSAFDAEVILAACAARQFRWVVPMNADRRLAQAEPRPQVMSLVESCTTEQFVPVKLTPGKGPFVAQRRAAACRVGRNAKTRTFWVHEERCNVHNVGAARVFFSTGKEPEAGQKVKVQKVLMTNDLERSIEDITEIYDLRWQIELFFKEMKSNLGLADYRFRYFCDVEGWVNACLLAFMYLEWYRLQMLEQSKDEPTERERWRWQRSHGLALAAQQDIQRDDILVLLEMTKTPEGLARLQEILRQALPKEYRKAG